MALFMVPDVIFIEFYSCGNGIGTDILINCVHCGQLLIIHSDWGEPYAVFAHSIILPAVRASCAVVGSEAHFREYLGNTVSEIAEFLALVIRNI